jgi:PIN domain nuclease of toxin-antitoxin system
LKLLLDTHIWLWSLQDRERLGSRVEKELRDSSNEVWLSPISTWEALLLHSKGRILLHTDNLERWKAAATAPFREAMLTHEIAFEARQLSIPSRDPADRFLAATALVLGLTLVTADVMLLGLGNIATLANH